MAIFKCKMCGGTIEFNPGDTVGICDYCGTKQTLPHLDDDRRANLYDRANHFRRNNEFDKAAGIYEQILNEDTTDAEAYWSLVLCRYGIEYVEDPATHKRVPTVNRAQFTSIYDDDNYKSALQYADSSQRDIYEEEANAINEIQKGILAISQKEEPFDVFICYKETDANGRRTQDSVLANDLYHQLTNEGFKVFFSRITLEDKLGTAYEPYIFAALNSAKVMVVLGTRPEHFNAVWVKNEWSRYLSIVKQSGGKKILIPAYRDMDPYDLPEEFSHLQAQDMSKLGFMQDLIRGIKKIINADEPKQAVKETIVNVNNANIAPLLKRAFMFLEDGNWTEADTYCEKVLDQDPENAQAYLGKLMAEQNVRRQEDLRNCKQPFDNSNNYKKAVRFGDDKLSGMLSGYIDHINERNENARLTSLYNSAVSAMNSANTEAAYKAATESFRKIPGFKDADDLISQCLDKAEVCRKDAVYSSAKSQMTGSDVSGYEAAIASFSKISGWKDADEQIAACKRKIEEIKAKEEAERLERERQAEAERLERERQAEAERLERERQAEEQRIAAKKRKRTIAIVTPIIIACVAAAIVFVTVILPKQKLDKAMALIDSGDYEEAYAILEELGENDVIASSKYDRAVALIDSGDYEGAYNLLNGLNYNDSETLKYIALFQNTEIGDTGYFGAYEQDNNTSNGKEEIEWFVLAKEEDKILLISKYALDCQQYNTSKEDVTWETCSLRKWLNETFLNVAFSEGERAMIPGVTVSADNNSNYSTNPGNSTTDQVFLLSITEAGKYFSSDSARQCQGTEYCYAQGANKADNGNCWWWLRSPGDRSSSAACVRSDGSVCASGVSVDDDGSCVRPALWLDISVD